MGNGQRRISNLLKRFFFIKASPKTVGKALSEQGLTRQPRKKPKKNPFDKMQDFGLNFI
jgi:hypothetical protein